MSSYEEYTKQKRDFFIKHTCDTDNVEEWNNPSDHGTLMKRFVFGDGACWFECSDRVFETGTVHLHGYEIHRKVEFFRTEFWSTDNSRSQYYYEPVLEPAHG